MTALPDYLIAEVGYLRGRLSTNIDETSALERYAIATTGGVWAWIGTHANQGVPLLPWLPMALTMFLGFRAIAVYVRIKTIWEYLSKVEAMAGVPAGLGWIASEERRGARFRVVTATTFWFGINIFNLLLALMVPARVAVASTVR